MDLYFITDRKIGTNPLTNTPELIVPAVNVDREVIIQEYPNAGQTNIRFSEASDQWGVEPSPPSALEDFRIVLPAGIELWANASSSFTESGCQFLVTSVGR